MTLADFQARMGADIEQSAPTALDRLATATAAALAAQWLASRRRLDPFLPRAVATVAAANIAAVGLADDVVGLAERPGAERYVDPAIIRQRLTQASQSSDEAVALVGSSEPRQAAQARLTHHADGGASLIQVGGTCGICAPHNGEHIGPNTLPRHLGCACFAALASRELGLVRGGD